MGEFEKLKVWQLSKNLAVKVYEAVDKNEQLKKDLRLASQITSSAVSIPSNIAEGDELNTLKQGVNHLYIAKGSCAELLTQLIIANEIGKLDNASFESLSNETRHIAASIYKLIQVRKSWIKK